MVEQVICFELVLLRKEEAIQQQGILTAYTKTFLRTSDAMYIFHRGVQDGHAIEFT